MSRVIACSGFPENFDKDREWSHLVAGLVEAGWHVESVDGRSWPARSAAFLAFNHQPKSIDRARRHQLSPGRCVRLVMEPRATAPSLYTKGASAKYGLTISASPIWCESLGGVSVPWPQRLQTILGDSTDPSGKRDYQLGLVASNKMSVVPGSLYALRRQVIARAESGKLPMLVGGAGWDRSKVRRCNQLAGSVYRSFSGGVIPDVMVGTRNLFVRPEHYRGVVTDVAKIYRQAELALVIENSADYVSEKVVDAIAAGAVPVYVGPQLDRFNIPRSVAIEVEPNARSILDVARSVSPAEMMRVRKNGQEWLASADAASMSTRSVFTLIARSIAMFLN